MDGAQLGKVVIAKTAPGAHAFTGIVLCYTDQPTYTIIDESGRERSWVASLCLPATDEEIIEYWQRRTERAEERVRRLRKASDELEGE